MKQPMIVFKDFGFHYRAQKAPTISGINLTIYEGEKVLIVGPSGSGKSTLAHCMNGLAPFYYEGEVTGSLKVNGIETKEASIFQLSDVVGTVLQDPDGQFIGLTVAEDIAFKLENDCVEQDEMKRKVAGVAQLVGIEKHLDVAPHQLSGGQKQRVTLGGVMVGDVEVLLFDEPLASLDPATGKVAIELIDQLQKDSNKTVVIIEHRLEDVLHCHVDRIIVMHEGAICYDGTPQELLSTDLLTQTGIREPLYVTAMKQAGITVTAAMQPDHIDTLTLEQERSKEKLVTWFKKAEKPQLTSKKEALLTFEKVSFGYTKDRKILDEVSFTIHKGEMVSLVGQNGAGKSTISKLVCGFYHPTMGRILFDGKDMIGDTIKERATKIGMVMQNPNQMISHNLIFDEVAFGLRIRGVAAEEIEARVLKTLEICGLLAFRKWPISALSFGQKKRVTIAAILVLEPELLILDEPTAGQDFKHYTEIMTFLEQLNEQGITILMITHDMHLMLEYTPRALVLAGGRLVADTTTSQVLTDEIIIQEAYLKETSLYPLAIKAGIEEPTAFVEAFIAADRRGRGR